MYIRLTGNLVEIITMNKKKVIIVIISIFTFLLLASAGIIFVSIKNYQAYTNEALKDKYNSIIYEYLKPNRKVLLLEFNTKKTLPVTITPFFSSFSDRFRYGQYEIFNDFKVSNESIVNKKIFYDEELGYDLKFKDGLCFYCFDNEEIKGNKSIYWFDYDEYKRLKSFKEQYTYKDEIRDSLAYEYKYVYDFFSKTGFIFKFDKYEITAVIYFKETKNGYCISSVSGFFRNKEPDDYSGGWSANLTFENGLITEIFEKHYNTNRVVDQEYLVKIKYNDGLKVLEELSVKEKKDRKYKTIYITEYQYENRQIIKEVRTNYDELDRTNKEVKKSTSYNFIYDSNGNEISFVHRFESLKYKGHNNEMCVKTVITYK